MKDFQLNIRLNKNEGEELKEISKVLDVPSSQIVREAIRKETAELKRTHPKLQLQPETQLELSK